MMMVVGLVRLLRFGKFIASKLGTGMVEVKPTVNNETTNSLRYFLTSLKYTRLTILCASQKALEY